MAEVPRTRTPVSTTEAAQMVTDALRRLAPEDATWELATMLLAYAWFETGAGKSIMNHNWGNITTMPSWGHDYWRPPWFTIDESSSARDRDLHAKMLAGQAPQAFRAYASSQAGLDDYVKFLLKERYASVWGAMRRGDAEALGRVIRDSSYCPDCSPAVVTRNVKSFASLFEAAGLFDHLPKVLPEPSEPSPPSPSSEESVGSSSERFDLNRGLAADLHLLRRGSHGSLVILFQKVFLAGFYTGIVDGIFGPKTEEAVRNLQAYADITVDGWVGEQTWKVVI